MEKFDTKNEEGMFNLVYQQTGAVRASKLLRPQERGRNCSRTNRRILSSSHETACDFRARKLSGYLLFKSPLTEVLTMMPLLSTLVLRGITEQPSSIMHPAYLEQNHSLTSSIRC